MAMTANLHFPHRAHADMRNGASWVSIFDRDGNQVTIFMIFPLAEKIANAINDAQPGDDDSRYDFASWKQPATLASEPKNETA
jgi:hypothetical protein